MTDQEIFSFRIGGLQPAEPIMLENLHMLELARDSFHLLAEHHTPDQRHSYSIIYDASASFGHPGDMRYLAIHVSRDSHHDLFRCGYSYEPTVPFAQRWLIERGCPANHTVLRRTSSSPSPADASTRALEERLRLSGSRYRVLGSYFHEPIGPKDGTSIRVLAYDQHPDNAHQPYRIFLETVDTASDTYRVHEGAFTTIEDSNTWLMSWFDNPALPLPPPIPYQPSKPPPVAAPWGASPPPTPPSGPRR
ncbi:hypothetical protein [Streptomyces hainanensis]|uniref:Uncharacterized protein n=1 Tax=Streptomyces hainanensis TaxID=402648 RepID=A0A4R4TE67_9ACTN|nr:hypothetical protein [Streptomyces hainanensis]TDC72619.1 hypothetical protein E1283_21275 [Streptomyces hainanensis]